MVREAGDGSGTSVLASFVLFEKPVDVWSVMLKGDNVEFCLTLAVPIYGAGGVSTGESETLL